MPEPYRARPARCDDLDALVALFEARDLADVGFVDQSRDEILDDWAEPSLDMHRDTIVAEAPDGSIAGYAIVLALDPSLQIFANAKVHPHHVERGIGSALIEACERRASKRVGPGATSAFRMDRPATDAAAERLFLDRGYRHVRSFWHMQLALPADDLRAPPDGVTLRMGWPDDEPIVHRLLDETFRDHFGYEPESLEHWQQWLHATSGYDPALTVLAHAGERPVGVSVNRTSEDGVGWVDDLGVLTSHRRLGIARALLARSFAELSASGHHEVRLGVDTENTTGATALYEGVGMTVRRRYDVYQKHLIGT